MLNIRGLAVILIDMQDHFVGMLDVDDKELLVRSQTKILEECSEHDIPVVVLEFGGYGRTIRPLIELVNRIPRVIVLTKHRDDGFCGTNLGTYLRELRIQSVVLMGINASFCVKATAESAVADGYQIITGDSLIANCKCLSCKAEQKSLSWYSSNGLVVSGPFSLVGLGTTILV